MVRLALLAAIALAGAAAECMSGDKHMGPSGPCPPKANKTTAKNATVIPSVGVGIARDQCGVTNLECGNSTVSSSCGMCTRGNGSVCLAGNRKGPDDKSQCCEVWKYDGFEFDYAGECKNERSITDGAFNYGSHAHYSASWDPVLGCKQVAYKLSEEAQVAWAAADGTMANRTVATAEAVYARCVAAMIPPKGSETVDTKMCSKVKAVILDEGVGAFKDLGRFCLSLLSSEREAVSRSLYQIKPWPKKMKTECKLNCGLYGKRTKQGCGCECLGNWYGKKCDKCNMDENKCGKEVAVQRFETRFCKCVCRVPYMVHNETGACAKKVNMTAIVDFVQGGDLKNDVTINKNVFAPFVPKEFGGSGKNISEMKTATPISETSFVQLPAWKK